MSFEVGISPWSGDDNKAFEKAIAKYSEDRADRWEKIALEIPGKSMYEIKRHYDFLLDDVRRIESGIIQSPNYGKGSKASSWARRNSFPWTQEEHRMFLIGLENCERGDWRSISRKFVITKSSTQVASHAQKHFLRKNSSVVNNEAGNRLRIRNVTTAAASPPHIFEPPMNPPPPHPPHIFEPPMNPPPPPPAAADQSHFGYGMMPSSANGNYPNFI